MSGFRSGLELGAKIGNGHFGEVHLGQDQVHGPVAVKVLTRDPFDGDATWESYKTNFLKEGQILSRATHRNVVQVHHLVEAPDGDSLRLCMAYCPGGSLQGVFEAGPMTTASVRKAATEVLLGLSALHARGMLHRDIKPGNILLDRCGVALISDFGLVTDDLVLGYGSQAGYSDHLAYEVWQGRGTSEKSDIWAFGMTLYRLLHGKAWYDEARPPRRLIEHGGFVRTLRWLPHVPAPWRRVLRSMLNDDPAARCPSADRAISQLARLPVAPAWSASVTPALVRWELRGKTRLNVVEWHRHAPRKHEWSAWSEPLGSGRKMRLGGSGGIVGSAKALSELETYFASWRSGRP